MMETETLPTEVFTCIVRVCFTTSNDNGSEEPQLVLRHIIECNGKEYYVESKQLPDEHLNRTIALLRGSSDSLQIIEHRLADAALEAAREITENAEKHVLFENNLNITQRRSFVMIHDYLYKVLKEAKQLYRRNKKHRQWRQMVKAEYPVLPEELIEKLEDNAGHDKYECAPSRLALIYTAKCFDLELSAKQIYNVLKKLREEFPLRERLQSEKVTEINEAKKQKKICEILERKLITQK